MWYVCTCEYCRAISHRTDLPDRCDNCLLLLPLRGGAIAWGVVIALYSIAGSIVLLRYGQYLFFVYPEWFIYGGIGMGVGAIAIITIITLSNRSYIWTRVCTFLWPFVIVISAVRAILMIVQLQRGKDKIQWECQNGGQLWTDSAEAGYGGTTSIPDGFCGAGFSSLNAAFIIGLLVDLVFQLYMYFMIWRFQKRLEHYQNMKGPFYGGGPALSYGIPARRYTNHNLPVGICHGGDPLGCVSTRPGTSFYHPSTSHSVTRVRHGGLRI